MGRRAWLRQLPFALLAVGVVAWLARGAGPGDLAALGVDLRRVAIDPAELYSGGQPPQGIPALGFAGLPGVPASRAPRFEPAAGIAWLEPREPVVAVTLGGETRAYPLQVLTWHEIVNDVVGGVPVAVTFCPLCNSAFAFDLRLPLEEAGVGTEAPDRAYLTAYADQHGEAAAARVAALRRTTLGTSGLLYRSNLVMLDSATATLWPQLSGEGAVGALAGARLLRHPARIVAFEELQLSRPEAPVLSRDTGYRRLYGRNPYPGYDRLESPPFLYRGPADGRLPPKARVAAFVRRGEALAVPFARLREERVVNDELAGLPLVVAWRPGVRSALDAGSFARGDDVGTTVAYARRVGGRTLRFVAAPDGMVDRETGTRWTLEGEAVEGPLAGARLRPLPHDQTLWFAWAAFRPDTRFVPAGPAGPPSPRRRGPVE